MGALSPPMGFNCQQERLMQHKNQSIFVEMLLDKDSAHFVFFI